MDRKRKTITKICGCLAAWMVILFVLTVGIYGIAGDGSLIAQEMLRHAPPETTGLPEKEYDGVGRMTAGYLTGQEAVFQYAFSDAEGRVYLCFQDHEADHMADCRELIRLAGTLRWITGGSGLFLIGAGMLFRRYRKIFAGGMLAGLLAAGILITGLAAWAAADFDGLFTAFHRAAFTNDGWLLNPRTDLLIRLMPVGFFITLAARLAMWMLAAGLAAGAAAWTMKKREGMFRFPGESREL